MLKENFDKAVKLQEQINLIDTYIRKFKPDNNIVYLHVKDHYGNGSLTLDLYAHEPKTSMALGYTHNNFTEYYKEFLKKCVKDLKNRKLELECQFSSL